MQVTILGDLASVAGAISVIGYLMVGQRLRAWMPIFLYACPVTGVQFKCLPYQKSNQFNCCMLWKDIDDVI